MSGSIKVEIKIDCGICLEAKDLFSSSKKDAAEEARRMGWKKKKKEGWVCPSCLN